MVKQIDLYPITIIEDRYNGVYSGGSWLAIANSQVRLKITGESRIQYCLNDGPHGDDTEAWKFGKQISDIDWIAVGNTPQEALDNLVNKNSV